MKVLAFSLAVVLVPLCPAQKPSCASLAFGPHSLDIAACPYTNSHDFPWTNKQRYPNGEAILERRFIPGALLL